MISIPWLSPESLEFPAPGDALPQPNGLLAAGGDLSAERLLAAYGKGIFPWYNPGDPILWWSPDPRGVIYPHKLKISRSLKKTLKSGKYRVTVDHSFEAVIRACSEPRSYADGTWISEEMIQAYLRLHHLGIAHSFETWDMDGNLVGGLYGLSLGKMYFGESMFSRQTDASKVAFVHLIKQLELWGCPLIDTQLPNPHLLSLGAETMPRNAYLDMLESNLSAPLSDEWQLTWTVDMLQ